MQVTTQIGNNHDFQLKQAILIYEDQISKRAKFATVHRVSNRIRGNPRRWRRELYSLLTFSHTFFMGYRSQRPQSCCQKACSLTPLIS